MRYRPAQCRSKGSQLRPNRRNIRRASGYFKRENVEKLRKKLECASRMLISSQPINCAFIVLKWPTKSGVTVLGIHVDFILFSNSLQTLYTVKSCCRAIIKLHECPFHSTWSDFLSRQQKSKKDYVLTIINIYAVSYRKIIPKLCSFLTRNVHHKRRQTAAFFIEFVSWNKP